MKNHQIWKKIGQKCLSTMSCTDCSCPVEDMLYFYLNEIKFIKMLSNYSQLYPRIHVVHKALALLNVVPHNGKVTNGVMMKTTIVDALGMVEIAVEKMLKKLTAQNANVLTQKLEKAVGC